MAQFTARHPKVGGRAKGTLNKATLAGREFAVALVNDETYRAKLRERLIAGKVHPGVESMIWYFAIGKPKETLEVSGSIDTRNPATMTTEELVNELAEHHRLTGEFLTQHPGQQHTPGD